MNRIEIIFPPKIKEYVDYQCNNRRKEFSLMPEINTIKHHLLGLNPKVALDVGSGIGRASIFFFKQFCWTDTRFILADGDSGKKQLYGIRMGKADFYNSLSATKLFCQANGLRNFEVFNLERYKWTELGHQPDLVYSFKALGFHWPINSFLDDIHPKLKDNCLLIFGLRGGTKTMGWINGQLGEIDQKKYKIIEALISPRKSVGSIVMRKI